MGDEGIAPIIREVGTNGTVRFILQPLYPLGKSYRYTVNRRQIRPQQRTESSNPTDLRGRGMYARILLKRGVM